MRDNFIENIVNTYVENIRFSNSIMLLFLQNVERNDILLRSLITSNLNRRTDETNTHGQPNTEPIPTSPIPPTSPHTQSQNGESTYNRRVDYGVGAGTGTGAGTDGSNRRITRRLFSDGTGTDGSGTTNGSAQFSTSRRSTGTSSINDIFSAYSHAHAHSRGANHNRQHDNESILQNRLPYTSTLSDVQRTNEINYGQSNILENTNTDSAPRPTIITSHLLNYLEESNQTNNTIDGNSDSNNDYRDNNVTDEAVELPTNNIPRPTNVARRRYIPPINHRSLNIDGVGMRGLSSLARPFTPRDTIPHMGINTSIARSVGIGADDSPGSFMRMDRDGSLNRFLFNFDRQIETHINVDTEFEDFMSPVPVTPTPDQIENAIETITFCQIIDPNNTRCPISLIPFEQNDVVTRILYCGHIYLGQYLSTWFGQNVRCPLCRYDIRTYIRGQSNQNQSVSSTLPITNTPTTDDGISTDMTIIAPTPSIPNTIPINIMNDVEWDTTVMTNNTEIDEDDTPNRSPITEIDDDATFRMLESVINSHIDELRPLIDSTNAFISSIEVEINLPNEPASASNIPSPVPHPVHPNSPQSPNSSQSSSSSEDNL